MAEVRLSAIRIGFPYAVDVNFPAGFLLAGESVRTKFRRHLEDPAPVVAVAARNGDTVTWTLTKEQTADMAPGSYIAEAEIFTTATPLVKGQPLTTNRYIADCDYSPAE